MNERTDDRQFVLARGFSSEVSLHCYGVAHQELIGMLEVTTMVDFLRLRLRGASQDPLRECTTFVVDIRAQPHESEISVEDVADIVTYLLSD